VGGEVGQQVGGDRRRRASRAVLVALGVDGVRVVDEAEVVAVTEDTSPAGRKTPPTSHGSSTSAATAASPSARSARERAKEAAS
jgi:uncharacterized Ntn-hydrolase superfamily protein